MSGGNDYTGEVRAITGELRAVNARLKKLEQDRESDREDFLRHLTDAKESVTKLSSMLEKQQKHDRELYGNGKPGLVKLVGQLVDDKLRIEKRRTWVGTIFAGTMGAIAAAILTGLGKAAGWW